MTSLLSGSLIFTMLASVFHRAVAANNSSLAYPDLASTDFDNAGYVISVIDVNETATGSDLWCYECRDNFKKIYDPDNVPCLKNLSQIIVRQCGVRDRFCRVERITLHRQVVTIERGCAEICYYGCKYHGYGLTLKTCTSCCNTYGCNTDSGAMAVVAGMGVYSCILTLSWTLLAMGITQLAR